MLLVSQGKITICTSPDEYGPFFSNNTMNGVTILKIIERDEKPYLLSRDRDGYELKYLKDAHLVYQSNESANGNNGGVVNVILTKPSFFLLEFKIIYQNDVDPKQLIREGWLTAEEHFKFGNLEANEDLPHVDYYLV